MNQLNKLKPLAKYFIIGMFMMILQAICFIAIIYDKFESLPFIVAGINMVVLLFGFWSFKRELNRISEEQDEYELAEEAKEKFKEDIRNLLNSKKS